MNVQLDTNLEHFGRVIKGNHANPSADSLYQVVASLARVGVNNLWLSGQFLGDFLDESNLVARGAVKVASHNGERLDNDWIGVALDGVKGLYARKEAAPLVYLYNSVVMVYGVASGGREPVSMYSAFRLSYYKYHIS